MTNISLLSTLALTAAFATPAFAGDPGTAFCFGVSCPCDNDDADSGCVNSTGVGATLSGSGSDSVSADDLVLTATDVPSNSFGVLFRGSTELADPVDAGDGLLCVGPLYGRGGIAASGDGSTMEFGPGFAADSQVGPPFLAITAGSTWNFQVFYRDVSGPCGNYFNLTNGYSVTFSS